MTAAGAESDEPGPPDVTSEAQAADIEMLDGSPLCEGDISEAWSGHAAGAETPLSPHKLGESASLSHSPSRVFRFVETFAGKAGLTKAVAKIRLEGWEVQASGKDSRTSEWDLSNDEHFEEAMREVVTWHWNHGAPPCGTMSTARRADEYGHVQPLRDVWRPTGYGDPLTEEANLLARRQAALCQAIYDAGGYFSVENPESSFLWLLKEYKALAALKGVRFVVLHQCAYGSPHYKPTGILTNAPWLFEGESCRQCKDQIITT